MTKCKNCLCDCHCNVGEHSDANGVCACEKCNKMCHCTQAGSEEECTNCDCGNREEDSTYEGGGVVVDDTGECESCQ